MSKHQLRAIKEAKQPGTVTPEVFFGTVVPSLFAQKPAAVDERIGFDLSGEGGGIWLVDLQTQKVEKKLDGADVTVSMAAPLFEKFLLGTINPVEEEDKGNIKVVGNRACLRTLAAFLSPPQAQPPATPPK